METLSNNGNDDQPPTKIAKLLNSPNLCCICKSESDEPLLECKPSDIPSLQHASLTRKDFIFGLFCPEILYHNRCFNWYTSEESLGGVIYEDTVKDEGSEKNVASSASENINWSCCIICGKLSHKKCYRLIGFASLERVEHLLKCAVEKNDIWLQNVIKSNDLILRRCVYHNACLTSYMLRREATTVKKSQHEVAFENLVSEISAGLLVNKKAFLVNSLLIRFRTLLKDVSDANSYQSKRLQSRLIKHFGDKIMIQNQYGQGKSNIIMASNLTLLEAVKAVNELEQNFDATEIEQSTSESNILENEEVILYKALSILRKDLQLVHIPPDTYPAPQGLSLEASAEIIPKSIYHFVQRIIDDSAYEAVSSNFIPSQDVHRRTLSISECLLFCSRKIITPLHLGLGAQLHHQYGAKKIIGTLYSCGFCVSYDEVRKFLTSIAQNEIDMVQDGNYIPKGLTPANMGGHFIQEEDDNIDTNCQTLDGKDTFHSMARVVFQRQASTRQMPIPIVRESLKTLPQMTTVLSLMACQDFEKPKQRPCPPRNQNALDQITKLQSFCLKATDIAWVFLRMVSRSQIPFSIQTGESDGQVVPFWNAFNLKIAPIISWKTIATYAPIVDAKPSDMATVYTTMKRCKAMTEKLGQKHSVQTMDLQLYSIAQQIKWFKNEELKKHIMRLGGFHTACSFIGAIGKIWGDGGLYDILIDTDVYSAITVDSIIQGKKRGTRAYLILTECFLQLLLSSFLKWCTVNNHSHIFEHAFSDALSLSFETFRENDLENQRQNVQMLIDAFSENCSELFQNFVDEMCATSPTFKFWFLLDLLHHLCIRIRIRINASVYKLYVNKVLLPPTSHDHIS